MNIRSYLCGALLVAAANADVSSAEPPVIDNEHAIHLLPLVENDFSWNRIGLLAGVNGTVSNLIDEFYEKASRIGVSAALVQINERISIRAGVTGFILVEGRPEYSYKDPPETENISRLDAIQTAANAFVEDQENRAAII